MLEEQFEGVTEADVRDRLAAIDDYEDIPLSSRAAWKDTHADYDRGARLLYVVDAAVRTGSDGDHTIFDVFRAMNRHGGPITVQEFVRIVERYSGEDEPWLQAAITESGDLDAMIEESGVAFED
jgi:predicted metalloprotease with PDZ domain